MDCVSSLLFCFPGQGGPVQPNAEPNEKAVITTQPVPYSDDAAGQFIETLRTAEKPGKELERRLNQIVSANGWTENLAQSILRGLEKLVKDGASTSSAMAEAVEKATNTAKEFVKEHPYYTVLIAAGTIIALGVLIMLAPWVLEALGFGANGPRLGK
ncbi:hypothetical protein G7Z17_g11433 [Cylindrodendrum hubeiense]|uniref:Uncharacterized protein n=1 Tax=Cylindrodendrum hubeiense TaxID=595255 RepID=A0A9P5H113_9HYPO|nr:hypothetical protein G7Z17_g11433 [Cylindrodendrum hubeiense]